MFIDVIPSMPYPSTDVNACGRLGSMTSLEPDCCPPPARPALPEAVADELAAVLKAVAEPTRLRLLSLVAGAESGEACICDLTAPVGLSQPTVSHHMRILVDAGLLTREQRGKWAYYRLVDGAAERLAGALQEPFKSARTPLASGV
jgi:ArsR family transcriptional regulator